ncbi:bifunctional diaminohydroxyphosphoribosylaminopyrimidine deaminase/5-amino-6-(5-phosphoribosylamino)uracil reductase RibD [Lignipirellula cremea]|uniref:Riboflavin biosynthesis protein RibD n=1 Tax=Lignipirellula cremea TaxID=2528010 RepID=A0A518DQV6_9BACT|nr:bifunctional diaminohydroxyphosphoribosylaminopyrimidine deaminase/5-amino-6-(5-phosphoribosylamino)uracil reductase RibD [Lignipirellula cremea]QDU94202.1 Riboflavin biosynthesis protein RibD [Lignipirellula cremea]
MMNPHEIDLLHMRRALELAGRGQGSVEPNPLVGCVIARGTDVLAEGWHQKFGGPHAEVEALRHTAGVDLTGATLYVTLEPCSHHGKTPPCADAIIAAGIGRVAAAISDPFPAVDGEGFRRLREAGIEVEVGLAADEARQLLAPFAKRETTGRPWMIAKWAMTLDGKIASRTGSSRWISNALSRAVVHQLRGRVDAVLVGRGTAAADDPLLTSRPPGPRTATRIVIDSLAAMPLDSRLVQTADEAPVLLAVGPAAPAEKLAQLRQAGVEVLQCDAAEPSARLENLLDELGRRRMTNVLVEGGAALLGSLFDLGQIDEAHVFVAPQLIGGAAAPSPLGGVGLEQMPGAIRLLDPVTELLDGDIYLHGRLARPEV